MIMLKNCQNNISVYGCIWIQETKSYSCWKRNKVLLSLAQTQFETNKLTMFLETEAAFPYCNWSLKMTRNIWFGLTSVDIGQAYVNNWKRLGLLPFWVYVKLGKFLKLKYILYLASKRKISVRKKEKKMVFISICSKLSSNWFPFNESRISE